MVDPRTDAGPEPWPSPPERPAPPAAPRFECPDGYRAIELESARVCDPWEGARPRCAPGELLRAGRCEAIATDCGTDVPSEASDPGVVLVRPGSAGGDGSLALPFGTIAEALASGARIIALSAGEHALDAIVRDATLVGTCPTRTTLRIDARLGFLGATTLRRLRVTGAGQLTVPAGSELVLDRVEIDGMHRAVDLEGSLRAHRTAFHDIVGEAIAAFDATSIVLEDVALERIGSAAIALVDVKTPRAVVSLTGVVLADVGTFASRASILLDGAATLHVERLVIEDSAGPGLVARASTSTLEDVVLRRLGGAALVLEQGRSDVARVWITDAVAGVTLASGEHHARDLAISDTTQIGLLTLDASGDAERVEVRRAGITGVDVSGGDFTLRDLRVVGVDGADDVTGGAVLAELGARLTLERALLEGSEHFGLAAAGAALEATDLEVRSVRDRNGGYGVLSLDGAQLSLARAWIHDVSTIALGVQDATATAEDLLIEHVSASDGIDGLGMLVVGASSATLLRAELADTVRWGVLVSGLGASIDATDLDVRATHAAPCGDTSCRGTEGGAAIVAHDGASLRATRFSARECELAGVIATTAVTGELTRGRIEGNAIGMIVSPSVPINPPSGPGLTLRDVRVAGNAVDQQATELELAPPRITF